MATYILLTKLSSERLGAPLKRREAIGRKWFEAVKRKCPEVKWIAHYGLLGPFDFMDIYEAPNEEVAAKVSMITMSQGAVKAESWTALPYKRFLEIAKKL
ncbi:MAG: GYD domain-containing protein [Ignavibacteriales bacterium]|nr:GYD domain-containing protein [Ignavibacteriales bacterium]